MTSILSAISGKFGTSLILGTFFPVTIFVILARLLLVPLLPGTAEWSLLAPLAALDEAWELLAILLTAIVLTGLFYNLNVPHVRLYEGYFWEETWIGRKRTQHYQAKVDALLAQEAGVPALLQALMKKVAAASGPDLERLQDRIAAVKTMPGDVARALKTDYPKRASVLPTRLGNVIRSFENYPQWQYNMASITLWPRLIAAIDSRYASVIEEAKSSFDFMLNAATLSGLLALLLALAGLAYPLPAAATQFWVAWLFPVALFAVLAGWFYRQAIGRALAWGTLIKGAFDLYRGELLKQLGYRYTPSSVAQERRLWHNISNRLIFGDPPKGRGKLWPYAPASSSSPATAVKNQDGVKLEVLRGVGAATADGAIPVTLEVRNVDAKPARGMVVTDTVPDAFDYQWNSAAASQGLVSVAGTNPYRFRLDTSLPSKGSLQLTYRMMPRSVELFYHMLSLRRRP